MAAARAEALPRRSAPIYVNRDEAQAMAFRAARFACPNPVNVCNGGALGDLLPTCRSPR